MDRRIGLLVLVVSGALGAFSMWIEREGAPPVPARPTPPELAVLPSPSPSPPSWSGPFVLTIDLPPAPRRLPLRPVNCTQLAPDGPEAEAVLDAVERRACPEALDRVRAAMVADADHCALLAQAWSCFDQQYQAPLREARFERLSDLRDRIELLEGPATADPSVDRPAKGGLEYRLEAFASDPELRKTLADLFGEPTVTDRLTDDLWIEGLVAMTAAQVPVGERTEALERMWARRVYVLTRALHGEIGILIDRHRTSALPALRNLLEAAADGPASVREAYRAAGGEPAVGR